MAVYIADQTVAYNALPAGGIEQVSVLPAVGEIDHLYYLTVPDGTHDEGLYYYTGVVWKSCASGGEGGTNDYNDLVNKPRLNGIELAGNKSYTMMDIAQLSNTYTKVQVDTLIASAQKVYLTDSIPTPVNNVGLYYVDTAGTGDSYEMYLVDTARNVAHLGSAGISLAGYQKEQDLGLETLNKTVVGSINELKYRIDNLPTGGEITMNGFVNPSPTFYAPETSGTYNQVLVSRGANAAPEWVSGADSGTKVKLNGSSTVATNAAFYAPTGGGVAGYILRSQGEGLPPVWEEAGEIDGAKMQLNGALTDVTGEKVKIYAPDVAGAAGQVLTSTAGKPEWKDVQMNLNSEDTKVNVDDLKIYAPIESGTKGQTLISEGEGKAPVWKDMTGSTFYGTCTSSAASQVKQVTCPEYVLAKGAIVAVKFDFSNLTAEPMLDVNNTGYKPIIVKENATYEPDHTWRANSTCTFMYDGENYVLLAEQISVGSIFDEFFKSQVVYDKMYPVGMTIIQPNAPQVWDGVSATWEQLKDGHYICQANDSHKDGTKLENPQVMNIAMQWYHGWVDSSAGCCDGHITWHNGIGYEFTARTGQSLAATGARDRSINGIGFNASRLTNSVYKDSLSGDDRLRPVTTYMAMWKRTA